MTTPNPFDAYRQPAPTQETTPPPVTMNPTQNPATISPTVADPAAQYQAWLASQAAAAQVAPAPVAAPPVDPAYAAFLASQQAAPAAPAAPPVAAAPVDPQYAAWLASQQAAPTPNGATSPVGTDPFDDPAPPRPKGPRLDDMYGRLLIVIPKGMDKATSTDDDGKKTEYDRMTADVIILDGPSPMPYGGQPNGRPPTPHDRVAPIPHREVGMYISAKAIISQSRDAWAKRQAGQPGMVLGRLNYGEKPANPKMSAPWVLDKATDADRVIARAYLATIDPFA